MFICKNCKSKDKFELMFSPDYKGDKNFVQKINSKDEIEITSKEDRMHEKYFANIKYSELQHKFVRKDIPAFKSEDFISSVDDYIAKISFQLSKVNHPNGRVENVMSTWESLIKDLEGHDDFGKFISKVQKDAEKIINIKELNRK